MVDRIVGPPVVGPRRHRQHAVGDRDAGVRLDDVDVVGLDLGAVRGVDHGHRGVRLQQLGQPALVVRVEMLDDDQGEAGPRRQRRQQLGQGAQSAGRGAKPNDWKQVVRRHRHLPRV